MRGPWRFQEGRHTRHNPGKSKAKAIKQLEAVGYHVILEPLTDAA